MPTPVQQPYSKPYSERVYTICASNSGSSSSSMVQSFTPYPTDELTLDHTYVNDDDSFSQNESDYADTYEDRFDSTSGISTLNDTFSDAICLHDYNLTEPPNPRQLQSRPKLPDLSHAIQTLWYFLLSAYHQRVCQIKLITSLHPQIVTSSL